MVGKPGTRTAKSALASSLFLREWYRCHLFLRPKTGLAALQGSGDMVLEYELPEDCQD